ncbi:MULTISPECIES: MFS transporter [unclassified Novosphingobium]|uniref:MFS transporter n=1 Tax=unclassified Novosphingobium TaxID=2644732 RepID=UPI00210167B8|nr:MULTISPECIES: MFS transporter [unclassified Novosphingobium]
MAASFTIAGPLAISLLIVRSQHLPESWIGYYTSLIYAAAIVGSISTARLMASFSVRTIQLGSVAATGLGYALFACIAPPPLQVAAACLGIVLMGLAYGVIVPSSSLVLAECYSSAMQPLVVSVRQTGVPVGTTLVALIAPHVAQQAGWQSMTLPVLALLAATFVLSLPGLRPFGALSANLPPRQRLLGSVRSALSERATRQLALIAGVYAINQAALTTYLVPGLVWLHGLSVGKAAGYLAIATMAGAAARIVFGMTTSRWGRAMLHLALIGLLTGAAWLLLLWPLPSAFRLVVGSMLLGMTAMGWNGILLAELGLRAAPTGRTAEAVATGTSFAYLGVLIAPLAFVQLDHALGSKAAALGGLALLAVLAGASLLKGSAQLPNRPSPS